jgi:nucleoside-diphosphate-sugar epimerase
MKLLVTGANGFIGSNLCKYLLAQQIFPRILLRKSCDLDLLKQLVPQWKQMDIVYGDLLEPASLRPAVRGIDYIIHLAGTIKGSTFQEFNDGNCIGTKNLLQICLEESPHLKRLVHVSSMVAGGAGTPECPSCEDTPSKPLENDWYGMSKFNAECMSKRMVDKLPIVMVRPPMVVGPGDKISFDLFSLAKSGIKLYVSGEPRHFSVVHVEDLVNGIVMCITHPDIEGEIFNFACNGAISYRDLHEVIATKVFHRKYGSLIPFPIPPRLFYFIGYLMEMVSHITHQPPFLNTSKAIQASAAGQTMSNEKAKRILGWSPYYTIITALEQAGRWYQQQQWI